MAADTLANRFHQRACGTVFAMSYRIKIILVVAFSILAVASAAGLAVWSVQATDRHILQANVAQKLLTEHLQLSVHAYRLFKQLSDEIVLGSSANQSVVRNKRQAIAGSLSEIRRLELEQRDALGAGFAPGAVEDTDELEAVIELINRDFQAALRLPGGEERSRRVDAILEERIDVAFRERVNTALARQRDVITRMNSRIQSVHSNAVTVAVVLAIMTLLIGLSMGWLLVRGIATPLDTLGKAAETWARGEFDHRIDVSADPAFNRTSDHFNAMAARLADFARQHQRAEQELQQAVEARTQELSSANAALERADNVRRQFFADVSHELRTPLTVIRGEAQVALRRSDRSPDDLRQALEVVLEQSVGLSRLVDDMLFIARTNAERLRLIREPFRVIKLVDEVIKELARSAESREVTLRREIETDMKLVADPDRIRQLLIILLDNAIRHSSPQGTVTVSARTDSGAVRLTVSDQGLGIDAQDLPHIFERFFRGHREASRGSTVGLGLGLAVAKAIVEAHNGEISARSEAGQGTKITVKLPGQA